jgi:GNAT superfamily N-acetyltransferase
MVPALRTKIIINRLQFFFFQIQLAPLHRGQGVGPRMMHSLLSWQGGAGRPYKTQVESAWIMFS